MGGSREAFFATLSLLALSAYRVMPAMARINARMIAMRGQLHLLDAMESGTGGDWNATATAASELAQPIGIQVRDLTLRYSTSTAPVVHGLNFRFEPGTITAITGASGSGKSTLVALLSRLFDPDAGKITIDGMDLRQIDIDSLRRNVSIALQENILFAMSVRDNIRYVVPDADDESVNDAARVACVDDYIASLPDGLDTVLGDRGGKLSTGQRQ